MSLRGGAVIDNFSLTPPAPTLGITTAALRRNAALGAIAETLRLTGELLHAVREQPLATLRSGGVGIREMRRLADTLRVDHHTAAVLLEFCALSGPGPAGRGQLLLGAAAPAGVAGLPRQEQWLWLVNAWLASERAPSLVGQPINGQPAGPPSHRAAAGDHRQRVVRRGPAVRCARHPQEDPGDPAGADPRSGGAGRDGPGPQRRGRAAACRVVAAAHGAAVQLPDPRSPCGGGAAGADRVRRAQPAGCSHRRGRA